MPPHLKSQPTFQASRLVDLVALACIQTTRKVPQNLRWNSSFQSYVSSRRLLHAWSRLPTVWATFPIYVLMRHELLSFDWLYQRRIWPNIVVEYSERRIMGSSQGFTKQLNHQVKDIYFRHLPAKWRSSSFKNLAVEALEAMKHQPKIAAKTVRLPSVVRKEGWVQGHMSVEVRMASFREQT